MVYSISVIPENLKCNLGLLCVIPEKFNLKFYFGVFSGLGLVYLIIGPGIIE